MFWGYASGYGSRYVSAMFRTWLLTKGYEKDVVRWGRCFGVCIELCIGVCTRRVKHASLHECQTRHFWKQPDTYLLLGVLEALPSEKPVWQRRTDFAQTPRTSHTRGLYYIKADIEDAPFNPVFVSRGVLLVSKHNFAEANVHVFMSRNHI